MMGFRERSTGETICAGHAQVKTAPGAANPRDGSQR
jgi:hypothetical protein